MLWMEIVLCHGGMASMCWLGLRGAQWHIISILEDTPHTEWGIYYWNLHDHWYFLHKLFLPLSLSPNLDFQSEADGRIILPDLSPRFDKTLRKDGGKVRERKKVASIRLRDINFSTHTACAWGKAENNEHGSLVLRVCCFFKQKLEGKPEVC